MSSGSNPAEVFGIIFGIILELVILYFIWVWPILRGVRLAKEKGISPHWMWFGIHPILGWIACIVLLCITPRIRCPNCGGFVTVNFRICPYCHAGLDLQPNRTCCPTQPPSP